MPKSNDKSINCKKVSNILQIKLMSEDDEILIYDDGDRLIAGTLKLRNAGRGFNPTTEWIFTYDHWLGDFSGNEYEMLWESCLLNEKNVRHLRFPTKDEIEKVLYLNIK